MSQARSVSVVIPTYNRAAVLARAVRSALEQTVPPLEVLVIDDGSSDHTDQVLAEFSGRIQYIKLTQRRGAGHARNVGIQKARGEWIGLLDSDDEWLPDKLARQHALLDTAAPGLGGCYGWAERIAPGNGPMRLHAPRNLAPVANDLLCANVIGGCSTLLLRRDLLLRTGGFDERLPASQDWDLWLRLLDEAPLQGQPEVLIRYYDHAGQISVDLGAVYRGKHIFFGTHEARIRAGVSAQALARWQEDLARLSLLSGDFEAAHQYQRALRANRQASVRQRLLAGLIGLCPRTLQRLALYRRTRLTGAR